MTTKICNLCHQIKSTDDFYFRNKSKGSIKPYCKICSKQIYQNNKSVCGCGKPKHKGSKTCQPCKAKNSFNKAMSMTLGEKIYPELKCAKYSYIRYYAREIGKQMGFNCCTKCGYDKHFEVCHIRSIASFPSEATLSEINNPENLIALCPNCHWEFDNLNADEKT